MYRHEVALVSSSKNVRRGASVVAATVLSLLRLTRSALHEVAENEPGLLMHIRQVAIERRREIGEDIRSFAGVALKGAIVEKFAGKLTRHLGSNKLERALRRQQPGAAPRIVEQKPASAAVERSHTNG